MCKEETRPVLDKGIRACSCCPIPTLNVGRVHFCIKCKSCGFCGPMDISKSDRLQVILNKAVEKSMVEGCMFVCNDEPTTCNDLKSDRYSNLDDWCIHCCCIELVEAIVSEKSEWIADLDAQFRESAALIEEGSMTGWWDSCATRSTKDMGDELVEFGTWERHPDGYGRRWFYRPVRKV